MEEDLPFLEEEEEQREEDESLKEMLEKLERYQKPSEIDPFDVIKRQLERLREKARLKDKKLTIRLGVFYPDIVINDDIKFFKDGKELTFDEFKSYFKSKQSVMYLNIVLSRIEASLDAGDRKPKFYSLPYR
jgi:flagellar biosynthesis component FlhA